MRIQEISTPVAEQSNPTFALSFSDEDGIATTPLTLNWDLSAMDGTVIALNQSVSIPGEVSYITLSTSQTRFLNGETKQAERLLSIYATYNSAYGNGLVARKQVKFIIEQFIMIGYPLSVSVYDVIFTDDFPRDISIV